MKSDGRRWQQIRSAAAVLLLHAAAAMVLLLGVGRPPNIDPNSRPAMFDVPLTLPPPEPEPVPELLPEEPSPSGVARKVIAQPTPVIAVTEDQESPLLASPVAGAGDTPLAGGAGREGAGTGAGGTGTGMGTGTGRGTPTPARKLGGEISNRDYPRRARRAGAEGRVVSRLQVGADGRVDSCAIRFSSGDEELDRATCLLILQRFRFAPARDEMGRPVADSVDWQTLWWLGRSRRPDLEAEPPY